MTNFRALCAELFENLERYQCWYIEDNGYGIDELEALLDRADAALSQTELERPTDEELDAFIDGFFLEDDWFYIPEMERNLARAVLEHWGRQ